MNYLLDTSVVTRLRHTRTEVRDAVHRLRGEGGMLARCTVTDLEYGFSARNALQWETLQAVLGQFDGVELTADDVAVALRVQHDLAAAGLAGRKIADLLIAAVALRRELTLVHYDHDFEHIAKVSPLAHRWLVPAGTID